MARLLAADIDSFREECSNSIRQAVDCVCNAMAIRARLNPPATITDALPDSVKSQWGDARPTIETFLRDRSGAPIPVIDKLESLCASLHPTVISGRG